MGVWRRHFGSITKYDTRLALCDEMIVLVCVKMKFEMLPFL